MDFNLTTDRLRGVESWGLVAAKLTKKFPAFFMFAPCISSIKALFIVTTDAHCYKVVGIFKQNSDNCSDMFRFTQEPSVHGRIPSSTVYCTLAQQAGMPP